MTRLPALAISFLLISLLISPSTTAATLERYQKPGPALGLLSPAEIRLDPHTQKSVTVSLLAPQEGELALRIKADPGIILAQDDVDYRLPLNQNTPQLTLDIQSLEAGRYHLMFHADVQQQGLVSGRVFGLAVQVGPPAAQKAQDAAAENAPKLILMQGEEDVR